MEQSIDGQIDYMADPRDRALKGEPVYIFNLYPQKHIVGKGSLGTFVIPACEPGETVSKPCVIPAWPGSTYYDVQTHAMKIFRDEGKFVAQDIVHPFLGSGASADWSFGQNLDDLGVFWTERKVPTEKEISDARVKLESTYKKALADATQLETAGKLEFVTPMMRLAAQYFGEDRPWNKIYKKMAECFACGLPMKEGIIVHSCGAVYDWPKAISLGLRTREQAEAAGIDLGSKPKAKQSSQSV
jgi:hypothetical protein